MAFSKEVKKQALLKSLRRCCVCRVFAGRQAEVHHIVPKSQDGADTLNNAIVLCPRCHGEAGHYNDKHAKGNKYSPDELIKHRDLWWAWCDCSAGISSPEDPITVHPTYLDLVDSGSRISSEFAVVNQTHSPYWQVWLRISLDGSDADIECLEIEVKERSHPEVEVKRYGESSLDLCHIVTTDEMGERIMFVLLERLRPSEYFYFRPNLCTPELPGSPVKMLVSLWSFLTGPTGRRIDETRPSIQVEFPQPIKGRTVIRFGGRYCVDVGTGS